MFLRARSARRAVRAVAGVVATLLLSGNVLAAACLCVSKSPPPIQAASEALCPLHQVDDSPPTPTAQHCPADDPSAQVRTADLPGAQVLAMAAVTLFGSFLTPAPVLPELRVDPGSPQRPLYARLQRRQL
jgi:hypothetical protein